MTTLTILRGLPGSGKSTWARTHVDSNTVIVSLDSLREMMAGSRQTWHETMDPRMNRLLIRQAHTIIGDLLRKGVNVISDAQHADPRFFAEEVQIAARNKANVKAISFTHTWDVLQERNRIRPEAERVPEDYLRSQYEKWHERLEKSRWVQVHVVKQNGLYRMSPNGIPMLVDVGWLWNGEIVRNAEIGQDAIPLEGRGMTGTVSLNVPPLENDRTWILDNYIKWLESGAHMTTDGYANLDGDYKKTLLDLMRESDTVSVRPVNGESGVYACNFTRDAFKNHHWDEYSSKARGLFLDGEGNVVARGFDKFFNLDENEQTTRESIDRRLKFPVHVERKENGFLGLVSVGNDGEWRFWSKSGQTDYSPLIERLFYRTVDVDRVEGLKRVVGALGLTLAFEVIDQESDRHIIGYDESEIVFLHAIVNTVDFQIDYAFDRLVDSMGAFRRPEVVAVFQSESEREELWRLVDRERHDSTREGIVVYDGGGYMFKVKSDYYLKVKSLRSLLERVILHGKPIADNDKSERADRVRWVLAHADRDKLVYKREAFSNKIGVDMEYVGRLLAENGML